MGKDAELLRTLEGSSPTISENPFSDVAARHALAAGSCPGAVLDTVAGKTVSYHREDYRFL